MSFLNLPWQWDREDTGGLFEQVRTPRVVRWRRGPVTFYRFEWYTSLAVYEGLKMVKPADAVVQWWIYVADDFGFGITVPWSKQWAPRSRHSVPVKPSDDRSIDR